MSSKNLLGLILSIFSLSTKAQSVSPEGALHELIEFGQQIETRDIRLAATTQNGRIKPFDTLARETILFLTGSYKKSELNSVQLYLSIAGLESAVYAPLINVRGVELRKRLGFTEKNKYFSLADLENSQLQNLTMPLLQKEQEGHKLDEDEKKITEAFSQMNLFRQIATKQHLITSMDFSWLENGQIPEDSKVAQAVSDYLDLLRAKKFLEANLSAGQIKELTRTQNAPELFKHALAKLETEVLFFDSRPFLWAAIISLVGAFLLLFEVTRKKVSNNAIYTLFGLSMVPIVLGLTLRVYITQFAPITNMYGTMIWVAFGVSLFSLILFVLYKNALMSGFMFLGAGVILLLTENIPLILSPDMDPIVAVLRSNFCFPRMSRQSPFLMRPTRLP